MRTRRGLCYPRVVEDKNMRVVKRRRDFAAEQVSHRKRSRNSSDIAGKRDLFDSLPYDLVISILCKVSPSDLANVLLTMETLKRHLPVSGQEGLHELRNIAIRFEKKTYTVATSLSDYLRKISLKMVTLETKSQNPIGNALPSNSAGNSN
ncbi:hypothetical protein RGQ29_020698 [Quercus rubra]|uniref:Mediator complex subunit 15 KIX domain-containing protein n=1 Tax=Quercus rubra TaxID=3512 RepID=A0AAN7IUS6_QUERU|nr:hypothetical protein RGQ29_020698 [Quercus rubra]